MHDLIPNFPWSVNINSFVTEHDNLAAYTQISPAAVLAVTKAVC